MEVNNNLEDIMSGNLVGMLKRRGKYVASGILIGAGIGFIIATMTGKCKFCLSFFAAMAGGSTGYLIAKNPKYNFCC